MGWLRKTVKKIGKGIKKIGKKIGKVFKKILKPFAKVFNKLGPIGMIAMSLFLPGIGAAIAGWGAGMGASSVVGTMIKFVGNAIHYVATAPSKVFGTITDALGASWDTLANIGTDGNSWVSNFSNRMQTRIAGDGWFGGKSGSWASFDTTGSILPSGAPLTGEGQKNVIKQDNGQWVETLSDGSIGKPLSQANIDALSAQSSTGIPKISDGTVDRIGGDVGEGTYVDTITRKPLKLDKFGKPIPLKAGIQPSLSQTIKSSEIPFTSGMTVGEAGSNLSSLATAQGVYNDFSGAEEKSRPFSTGIDQSLIGSTDQGSLYSTATPWQPSYAYDATAAQIGFNTHNGIPQGVDPMQMNGYGGMTFNAWYDYNMLMNTAQQQQFNTNGGERYV